MAVACDVYDGVFFVLPFFPRDVLDEILDLIESVSEGFPIYSCNCDMNPSEIWLPHFFQLVASFCAADTFMYFQSFGMVIALLSLNIVLVYAYNNKHQWFNSSCYL